MGIAVRSALRFPDSCGGTFGGWVDDGRGKGAWRYHSAMPDHPQNSAYNARLADALTSAVADGRIGLPRFVRWLDRVDSGGSIEDSLAAGLEACNRAFGSKPVRERRTGDDLLHATIHAVWVTGASALISAGSAGAGAGAGPEIMLLGSSGAVYFDGTIGSKPAVTSAGDR